MVSYLILFAGFAALFAAGLPLALVFTKRRNAVWALAPFLGYAVITAAGRLLVVLGVPLIYASWPLAAVLLCALVWVIHKKKLPMPSKAFVFCSLSLLAVFSIAYHAVGSTYYRGYAWWDTLFCGSSAEFFRTSSLRDLTAAGETQPYLGPLFSYNHGAHRLSRAVFQAFVAVLAGVDGASTVGFVSLLGVLLVFFALVYITDGLKMKPLHRWAACVTGAALPGVALTHLEGFIAVSLFMGCAIISVKLFLDVFTKPSWGKTVLGGLFITAFALTLTDGLPLMAGLFLLSFCFMFTKTKSRFVLLIHGLGMIIIAFLALPPLNGHILKEIITGFKSLPRRELNTIYPFSYSAGLLTHTFFGSLMENAHDGLGFAARLASVLVLLTGLFGFTSAVLKKRSFMAFNLLALLLAPLLYLCQNTQYQYAFYKAFSLGAPAYIAGLWLFWEDCRAAISRRFVKIISTAGLLTLCGIMAMCAVTKPLGHN